MSGCRSLLVSNRWRLEFPLNDNAPYREGFLDFVRNKHLPLDFFSLDADGFKTTKLVLNTWNMNGIPTSKSESLETAAFQTAAAIYMQDSVLDIGESTRGSKTGKGA